MTFPADKPDLDATRATAGTDKLSSPDHLAHHKKEDDNIEGLMDEVGVEDSVDGTTHEYSRKTGWVDPEETWTRTGDFVFTVSGDVEAKYPKGTRIRYKQGGAFEYGVVISASHAAGTTTVTLAANDDYAMAAATITDNYYSYVVNPQGYPGWFAYSPTLTWTADTDPSGSPTKHEIFKIDGNSITVNIFNHSYTPGVNVTIVSIPIPVSVTGLQPAFGEIIVNNIPNLSEATFGAGAQGTVYCTSVAANRLKFGGTAKF